MSAPEASPAEIAARAGLTAIADRPPLGTYLRDLWQRRAFIVAFASARNLAMFSGARLGQLWQVLTPLLNAAIYFLVFGVLLKTSQNIDNYVGFLIIGIFVFTFTQRCVQAGSRAISGNLSLIRALHFPRAAMPAAATIVELQQMAASMFVMVAIVLATGEVPRWSWLLIPLALALQTTFNFGVTLLIARLGAKVADVTQLLPFVLRTWLYISGVFYSIQSVTGSAPGWVRHLLEINPVAVYIELVRQAMLPTHDHAPNAWTYAIVWAAVSLVIGFTVFFRGETTYGRG